MSVYKGQEKVLNSITAVEEEKVKEIAKEEAKEVYSTDEQVIGTWIDGKPLYRKVVDCGTLLDGANKNIPHGITSLKMITDFRGVACCGGAYPQNLPLPFPYSDGTDNGINGIPIHAWEERGYIVIKSLSDRTPYHAYVTLTYTKTTD